MSKKLSLLMAAAAVLAFAVPAFASAAETGLTQEGVLVPEGKIITFTNIGAWTITSEKLGAESCQNVMLEAKLITNTTSKVLAEEGGTQSATTCSRAGAEVKVKNIRLSKVETVGKEQEAGGKKTGLKKER